MVFQYGKVYKHSTGGTLRIVGVADTHVHGKCLVGEDDLGNLIPIGQDESAAVNYIEVTAGPKEFDKEHHARLVVGSRKLEALGNLLHSGDGLPPRIIILLRDSMVQGRDCVQAKGLNDSTLEALRLAGFDVKLLDSTSFGLPEHSVSW